MIVTNWIAKIVVKIAAKITPGTEGVTIWPFIFLAVRKDVDFEILKRLIKHEQKHLEQWKRYWIVGFPFVYLYQYLRYGYKNMSLEIEARNAEV